MKFCGKCVPLPLHLLCASAVLCCAGATHACAQAAEPTQEKTGESQELPVASPTATPTSEVPRVPGLSGLLHGLNAGISLSGLHDSQTGWATLMQPAIGFSFNDVFSVDVTVPIYLYRLAPTRDQNAAADQQLVVQRAEPGDVLFGLHGQFQPHGITYVATASATVPTGDAYYGLTSGRPTFDFSNRFERSFRRIAPTIELGVGDSTTIVNQLVTRNYTSLGPLAHFQAGIGATLPLGASFEADAYEQLPIGDQKIYDTIGHRGGDGPSRTVVAGRSVTEDNGFTNILDIPVNPHVTLSGYYNRSLRFRDDVVSFSVSYVLRAARSQKKAAAEDLLRKVEEELETSAAPTRLSQK